MASARPTGHPLTSPSRTTRSTSPTDGIEPPQAGDEEALAFVPAATDLLTAIGRDGCFKRLAPTFATAFGYTEDELLEQPFIGFIHPADQTATGRALEKLAQSEPTIGLENRFRCKDGSHRWLAWTALPTPEGLAYAVARDITERPQRQHERERSLGREQAATGLGQQQEELLASICHDVQQPLTVILAQIQLLQRQLDRGEMLDLDRFRTRLAYIWATAMRMPVYDTGPAFRITRSISSSIGAAVGQD